MASPNAPKLILLAALIALQACVKQTPVPMAPTTRTKPTPSVEEGRMPIKLEERGADLERRINLMEAEMRRIEMGLDESQKAPEERGRRARR